MNHYTYRAEWWPEHGEYVGRCVELPWLSRWAPTLQEATAAIERAVNEFIAERKQMAKKCRRRLPNGNTAASLY